MPVRCAQSDSAALCLAAALKETAGFTDVSLSDLTLSPSAIRELTQTLAAIKDLTPKMQAPARDTRVGGGVS